LIAQIIVNLVIALVSVGFAASFSAAQLLKVPYVSMSGFQWPLWIGERANLFAKHRVEAQLIYIPGGSLIIQTILSGEVGIASQSPTSAISAWGNGANLVLVAGGIERVLNVLMVSPQIRRAEDLKGKRVGISRFGSLSDWSLREALRLSKLRAGQDVVVVQVGGLGERMAGLTSGALDGAMLNTDQQYQVEKFGYHALFDFRKLPLPIPTQGVVASKEFVRAHRDNVKNFLKVYVEGIKVLKTDKNFSVAVLGKYLKLNDADLLSKTYDVYREAYESEPYVRREGIVQALATMPEIAAKNPKLNPNDIMDNSLLRELDKEGLFKELYSVR
jgi:NitT/TauT family transport system substrate-binding protein